MVGMNEIEKNLAVEQALAQPFTSFRELVTTGESHRALENLADFLKNEERFHELFEVRKIQLRAKMDLPIRSSDSRPDLPHAVKVAFEQGLLEICEEIGLLLFGKQRVREAWMYLQAVDDRPKMIELLKSIELNDENADDLIGLAIHEGLDPLQGMSWLLQRMGTCNAITTYDSYYFVFPLAIRRPVAEQLVQHLHHELRTNLVNHIRREQPNVNDAAEFSDESITELIETRPWVFTGGMRHIDESHLASVVRIGRIASRPDVVAAASDLCMYGQAMPTDYSAQGDAPFSELYVDSLLFYRALSGQQIEQAKEFFKARADGCQIEEQTAAAVEWYLYLLQQLGERRHAIDETIRLLPGGVPQMNIAASLFELCDALPDWLKAQQCFAENKRLLDYSVAVLEAQSHADSTE